MSAETFLGEIASMKGLSQESRVAFHNSHKLKLGLFGANCSSGRVPTLVEEVWSGNWEDNARLAQMADGYGLDFLCRLDAGADTGAQMTMKAPTLKL